MLLFYSFERTNDIVFTVEFLLFYLFERTKDIVFTVELLLLFLFERIYNWFCWCPICSGVFTVDILMFYLFECIYCWLFVVVLFVRVYLLLKLCCSICWGVFTFVLFCCSICSSVFTVNFSLFYLFEFIYSWFFAVLFVRV